MWGGLETYKYTVLRQVAATALIMTVMGWLIWTTLMTAEKDQIPKGSDSMDRAMMMLIMTVMEKVMAKTPIVKCMTKRMVRMQHSTRALRYSRPRALRP